MSLISFFANKSHIHAVVGSNGTDEVGSSDGTSDGSLLVVVLQALSGEESGTTLRNLEDDRGVDVSGSLKTSIDNGRRSDVL